MPPPLQSWTKLSLTVTLVGAIPVSPSPPKSMPWQQLTIVLLETVQLLVSPSRFIAPNCVALYMILLVMVMLVAVGLVVPPTSMARPVVLNIVLLLIVTDETPLMHTMLAPAFCRMLSSKSMSRLPMQLMHASKCPGPFPILLRPAFLMVRFRIEILSALSAIMECAP